MHYLVVEPRKRLIAHHRRGSEGLIETRIVTSGNLRLTPPGLSLVLTDVFGEP